MLPGMLVDVKRQSSLADFCNEITRTKFLPTKHRCIDYCQIQLPINFGGRKLHQAPVVGIKRPGAAQAHVVQTSSGAAQALVV